MAAYVPDQSDGPPSELHLSDHLNTIRPFTEQQLLDLWPNACLASKDRLVDQFIEENENLSQERLYTLFGKLEKCREQYKQVTEELDRLRQNCEEFEECAWDLNKARATGSGKCGCNRILEASHEHQTAKLRPGQLDKFTTNAEAFRAKLTQDYVTCLSDIQSTRSLIEIEMAKNVLNEDDQDVLARRGRIREAISVMFSFERRSVNLDTETSQFCRKLIKQLVAKLLALWSHINPTEEPDEDQDEASLPTAPGDDYAMYSFEDKLFILNHILRCPFGVSQWAAQFLQLTVYGFELSSPSLGELAGMELVRQGLALLAVILSPIKGRDRFVKDTPHSPSKRAEDDPWLLVEAEIDETEEVDSKSSQLSENDIISLIKQIQFFDLFDYVFKANLGYDQPLHSGPGQEMVSLKLLSFATHTIRILRGGLLTFNLMRYKNLTEYIKQMIKHTCASMSAFWEAKRRTTQATDGGGASQVLNIGPDPALALRLQVEYDHFILRSVTAILSCQKYGVWRCLSVIEYYGISEPMMWHILWVTFNSGRSDSSDRVGEVSPYYSDIYWRRRMSEDSFRYLFREKLKVLPPVEARYMVDCFLRMILSRTDSPSQRSFIQSGAQEMFSITFDPAAQSQQQGNIGDKGKLALILLSRKFPFLISFYIEILPNYKITSNDEMCLDLFSDLDLHSLAMSDNLMKLLTEWLLEYHITSLLNRTARIILSRLNWNTNEAHNGVRLNIPVVWHRKAALLIYNAYQKHFLSTFTDDKRPTGDNLTLEHIPQVHNAPNKASFVRSAGKEDFSRWCWSMTLLLRLDLLSQPDLVWLDIITEGISEKTLRENPFFPQPDITQDGDLLPLFRGYEKSEPLSVLITLLMCYNPLSGYTLEIYIDAFSLLVNAGHHLMALNVLRLTSLHTGFSEGYKNEKFISSAHRLIVSLGDGMLHLLIGAIDTQLNRLDVVHQIRLVIDWILLCYEVMHVVLKQNSSSWFGGAAKGALNRIASLLDGLLHVVFVKHSLRKHFLRAFSQLVYDMQSWKLGNGGSFLSNIFSWTGGANKSAQAKAAAQRKSEWYTPIHLLCHEFPEMSFIGWLLFESDTIKMEKIWEHALCTMSGTAAAMAGGDASAAPTPVPGSSSSGSPSHSHSLDLEGAIKKACDLLHLPQLPICFLPLHSISDYLLICPDYHPVTPLLFYNFFSHYFANGVECGSFGYRLLDDQKLKLIRKKLNTLVDKHHALCSSGLNQQSGDQQQQQLISAHLVKFYRACLIWLADPALHEPYLDLARLPGAKYQTEILRCILSPSRDTEGYSPVMASSDEYDLTKPAKELIAWSQLQQQANVQLESWNYLFKCRFSVTTITDASVTEPAKELTLDKPDQLLAEEIRAAESLYDMPPYGGSGLQQNPQSSQPSLSLIIYIVTQTVQRIAEDREKFDSNYNLIEQLDTEMVDLIRKQYDSPDRQITIKRACCTSKNSVPSESDVHCLSPANILINFKDSIENRQVTKAMIKNRTQHATLTEFFRENPSAKFTSFALFIEHCLAKINLDTYQWNQSSGGQDEKYWNLFVESSIAMAPHFCDTAFEPAKQIFQLLLEFICSIRYMDKKDVVNRLLVSTILRHSKTVQLLAPYIDVNASCSRDCFLSLYRQVISSIDVVSPQVTFVLLSKFDVSRWLKDVVAARRGSSGSSSSQRSPTSDPSYFDMFIANISAALHKLGPQPDDDLTMVLGLLRKHFQYTVTSSFPSNIQGSVHILLDGLDAERISPLLWADFLKAFGIFPESDAHSRTMYSRFARYARAQSVLNETEVYKVLRQL